MAVWLLHSLQDCKLGKAHDSAKSMKLMELELGKGHIFNGMEGYKRKGRMLGG